MRFHDRRDGGRRLAERLAHYSGGADVIVLGLPRGGVPVAFEVADALRAPLDVFLVRKLGVPGHDELAMGAIASGGIRVMNDSVLDRLAIGPDAIERVVMQEAEELRRRERAYRGDRPPLDLRDRVVILIDDGLATGSTMRAAAAAVQTQDPRRLVVAVPTAPPATCRDLAAEVDEVVTVITPEGFYAVGQWYDDFTQTSDAEVLELLAASEPAS